MIRRSAAMCTEACGCVHGFKDLKGSAAESADQNRGFCKELNKTQFCGRSPYTGGDHVISCVVVLLCCVCYVLLCIDKVDN